MSDVDTIRAILVSRKAQPDDVAVWSDKAVRTLLDALDAAASDGSLDVARLARAMAVVHSTDPAFALPNPHTKETAAEHFREWMLDAEAIAAEYARLSESPSEGKTE